jgi:hypothetical protein
MYSDVCLAFFDKSRPLRTHFFAIRYGEFFLEKCREGALIKTGLVVAVAVS